MSENNIRIRKVPVRRCTGCGEHFPKNQLIRVLRTPEGEILLDLTGKKSGRGAYLCRNSTCLRRAQQKDRLGSVLGCAIPREVYERLQQQIDDTDGQSPEGINIGGR